jgi:hypothetical protein
VPTVGEERRAIAVLCGHLQRRQDAGAQEQGLGAGLIGLVLSICVDECRGAQIRNRLQYVTTSQFESENCGLRRVD